MKFNKREKELIINALYMMECTCYDEELPYEIEEELGGTPNPDEVQDLMERIKG